MKLPETNKQQQQSEAHVVITQSSHSKCTGKCLHSLLHNICMPRLFTGAHAYKVKVQGYAVVKYHHRVGHWQTKAISPPTFG